jgi:hypothetical protein
MRYTIAGNSQKSISANECRGEVLVTGDAYTAISGAFPGAMRTEYSLKGILNRFSLRWTADGIKNRYIKNPGPLVSA